MRQYDFDPIEEIQKILDADLAEVLSESATEKLTIGEKAHLATALQKIGERLINEAREEALERVRKETFFTEYGVLFTHWPAHERVRVILEEVRRAHPPEDEEHKHFYTTVEIEENVKIRIGTPPYRGSG